MVIVEDMKDALKDTLTKSFVAVTMIVVGLCLYFTLEHDMRTYSQVLLGILSIGFLYWAFISWSALSTHLARQKDKEWLRAEEERKQILASVAEPKKKRQWPKLPSLFKRDWELIDKMVLPSECEQLQRSGGNIKGEGTTAQFFQQTVIYTFRCKLSGKVKTKVIKA